MDPEHPLDADLQYSRHAGAHVLRHSMDDRYHRPHLCCVLLYAVLLQADVKVRALKLVLSNISSVLR